MACNDDILISNRENDVSASMLRSFVRATARQSSRQTTPTPRKKMFHSLKNHTTTTKQAESLNSELTDFGEVLRDGDDLQEEGMAIEGASDSRQKEELDRLMLRESSWRRSCLHKGLLVNLIFLAILITGFGMIESTFPLQGVRKYTTNNTRDLVCFSSPVFCIASRMIRSLGVFGFMGGVIIWIAVEMLFRKIPFLVGSGVLLKQYKSIRETISSIVIETLFDPTALRKYFSGKNKKVREMLRVDTKLGLFNSEVVDVVIDQKIAAILAGPDGFLLSVMGADQDQFKVALRAHGKSFINEISPLVMEKLADPGLTDGVDLHEEAEKILGTKIGQLSSEKVRQLMAVMIRKHLSWLIVWGNILGAIFGLTIEAVALLLIFFKKLPFSNP